MPFSKKLQSILFCFCLAVSVAVTAAAQRISRARAGSYTQTNLVSNLPGRATTTDSNLKNPWGISFFRDLSPFWISDNNAGVATLYDGAGAPFPLGTALIVNIPVPNAATGGTPTGQVANIFASSNAFPLPGSGPGSGQPSLFIFATEDGTIAAWNQGVMPTTNAVLAVDNTAGTPGGGADGAVYKGLAIGTDSNGRNFIYATNFRSRHVDVFDSNFAPANMNGAFPFIDRRVPRNYAPFGIQNVDGQLFVTYARQDAAKHDPVAGRGQGFVDIFDTDGNLVQRFERRGVLDSPWGVAKASENFGRFAGDILIGNFGDGRINAYSSKGRFLGVLIDSATGKPLVNDGLWAITFGGALNSSPDTLYFTAGLNHEQDGLFGSISPSS
jgi:uncharacterized protein (TIGR03118 family)